jgi:hypothetical protein
VEICFSEVRICVCLWENRGTKKYILSLNLELVKVAGYDLSHPYDGPWNSHLLFKRLAVDTEADMSTIQYLPLSSELHS